MRLLFILALCTVLLPVSGAHANPPFDGAMAKFDRFDPVSPAPTTPITDGTGTATTLAAFKGNVLLVNFWATWCGPCVREMPSFGRLVAAFKDEKFTVVAVNADRGGPARAEPFLAEHGIANLNILYDPKLALARDLNVPGLPTTFLIDGGGNVVAALAGAAEWDSPDSKALIRYYLDRLK